MTLTDDQSPKCTICIKIWNGLTYAWLNVPILTLKTLKLSDAPTSYCKIELVIRKFRPFHMITCQIHLNDVAVHLNIVLEQTGADSASFTWKIVKILMQHCTRKSRNKRADAKIDRTVFMPISHEFHDNLSNMSHFT